MRTPVGSSKMVARSRAHSSPACDPSGVTLTFWADAADVAATTARKIALAAKCLMAPPVNASRGNVSRVLPTCWFDSICDLLHRVSRLQVICSAYNWLRGLALNQRPLGDEQPAMTDNPLILWERRSPAGRSTCSAGAWFLSLFFLFRGVVGAKWEQIMCAASDEPANSSSACGLPV